MPRARDVLGLFRELQRDSEDNVFGSEQRKRLSEDPRVASLSEEREGRSGDRNVLELLEVLALQHAELEPRLLDASFVVTAGTRLPSGVRSTRALIRDLIRNAQTQILAVGYVISSDEFLEWLQEAALRGVAIELIYEAGRRDSVDAFDRWPADIPPPKMWVEPDRPEDSQFQKMHAKCMVIDGQELYIGSANFTFHGLQQNLEFGVHLSGAPATAAREFFRGLIASSHLSPVEQKEDP